MLLKDEPITIQPQTEEDTTRRPRGRPPKKKTVEDGVLPSITLRPGDIDYNPFGHGCSKRKSDRLKEKLRQGGRKTFNARQKDSFIGISNGTNIL